MIEASSASKLIPAFRARWRELMPDDEPTIAAQKPVVRGKGWPDDYTMIWRGMSIGRIMHASVTVQDIAAARGISSNVRPR
jgi:hypothetical protein